MKFTASEINEILDGIYSGKYTSRKLPKEYFEKLQVKFSELVTKGFGSDDEEILNSLIKSTDEFSAAKTYQMVREVEVAAMAFGAKEAFTEAALNIFDRFTNVWGSAEENTALQQAFQAQKWQEIIMDSDLFPNLRYSTIGDACQICAPLNGIVAPINDPIWKRIYPTNHYNCFCLCVQEGKNVRPWNKGTVKHIVNGIEPKMSPVFLDNVGISQEIFNKKHPYFDVPAKDRKFAKKGFGLL